MTFENQGPIPRLYKHGQFSA